LDENEVPPQPEASEYTLRVPVDSYLFDIFKDEGPSDEDLATYVRGRIYWSSRFKQATAELATWEARRLGVDLGDLHQRWTSSLQQR
jgi:hypothetical protein